MFDADVACVFQRIVSEAGSLKVTAVASSEERRHRPHGEVPGTVELIEYCKLNLIIASLFLLPGALRHLQLALQMHLYGQCLTQIFKAAVKEF